MSWYQLSATSLSPQWRLTTLLMWGIWMGTSAGETRACQPNCVYSTDTGAAIPGYTWFNLFFPKLVEIRLGKHEEGGSLTHALWNVVIYTLGGIPGSLVRYPYHAPFKRLSDNTLLDWSLDD